MRLSAALSRHPHSIGITLHENAESDHTTFERLVRVPCASSACNKACRLPGTHKAALVNNGPCNSLGLTEINDLFECKQATAVLGMESIFTDEYAIVNSTSRPTGCEPSPQDVRMEVGLNGQQYSRSGPPSLAPRPILPSSPVLARGCLWCLRTRLWVLKPP